MKLSDYIKKCKEILDEHGDIESMFTAIDDEGNGYNSVSFGPEIRYLSPSENDWRPDYLISEQEEDQSLEDWLDDNCLDEEDIPKLKKVVLL